MKNQQAELLNPCFKEQEQSYACLNKNGFIHEKCEAQFENYNTCKKFWGKVYSHRRATGQRPYMPNVEDRARIKEEFMATIRNQIHERSQLD